MIDLTSTLPVPNGIQTIGLKNSAPDPTAMQAVFPLYRYGNFPLIWNNVGGQPIIKTEIRHLLWITETSNIAKVKEKGVKNELI